MAEEHRRVAAATAANARALADNLVNQGYVVEGGDATAWRLRKPRRRGDIVVTIIIGQPRASNPAHWGPPTGPPAG
jgi:hypothetical protein